MVCFIQVSYCAQTAASNFKLLHSLHMSNCLHFTATSRVICIYMTYQVLLVERLCSSVLFSPDFYDIVTYTGQGWISYDFPQDFSIGKDILAIDNNCGRNLLQFICFFGFLIVKEFLPIVGDFSACLPIAGK